MNTKEFKNWRQKIGVEQDISIEDAIEFVRGNPVVKKATADVWEMYIVANALPLGEGTIFHFIDIDEGSAGITDFLTLAEAEKAFETRLKEDARNGE